MSTENRNRTIKRKRPEKTEIRQFFATAALGLEVLLAEELKGLGAEKIRAGKGGVFFIGTLETACRTCLWTRLANRVFLPLKTFPALTPEGLYLGIREIDWSSHMEKDGTLAVDCNIARSKIKHSHFAALKAKDAIVDQFRDNFGVRPSVDLERPDIRINLHLLRNQLTVSLDLSGDSLHRRSYREKGGPAPLKENLAAAILLFSNWPAISEKGGVLLDPMCGSGTLLTEGALLAMDMAPGLLREYYGFLGWKGHQPAVWKKLLSEASSRKETGMKKRPRIFGFDGSSDAIDGARANARLAGLENFIELQRSDIQKFELPASAEGSGGLIVTNPPYGQRLGHNENLKNLYHLLGQQLKQQFGGWNAGILTASPELEKELGLCADTEHRLFNGPIECRLYHYQLGLTAAREGLSAAAPHPTEATAIQEGTSEMLANRLRKNLRNLRRWKEREGVTCYRIYDADIPEYAAAVDIYEEWVHVQEYDPPQNINPVLAQTRLREILATLAETLDIPPEHIFLKVRKKQKGRDQYHKMENREKFQEVREEGLRFLVNFSDYLDTGLFLDHRPTRKMIREAAAGKLFLNLFAYTGSASVYAAAGGAAGTLTVDSSRTYLEWAKRNFLLNELDLENHDFIQADCLEWLKNETRRFDLIFLDPPTFSNSRDRKTFFDIQRDYPDLLRAVSRLLTKDGELIFSNNFRKFKMNPEIFPELTIEDISAWTIPPDFQRNARMHRCWRIMHRKPSQK